ncbi:hypothetical protein [Rhizobium phage RHph_X2_26]|nr:hypothetical protein [Rhizobium phage RHph_X2_26]
MAMNKAERAEMDALKTELALERALRWPCYHKPVALSAMEIDAWRERHGVEVMPGWFFNSYARRVTHGCTGRHGSDTQNPEGKYMSRERSPMYRTKVEALMALRHALTLEHARGLAILDAEIEEADKE